MRGHNIKKKYNLIYNVSVGSQESDKFALYIYSNSQVTFPQKLFYRLRYLKPNPCLAIACRQLTSGNFSETRVATSVAASGNKRIVERQSRNLLIQIYSDLSKGTFIKMCTYIYISNTLRIRYYFICLTLFARAL